MIKLIVLSAFFLPGALFSKNELKKPIKAKYEELYYAAEKGDLKSVKELVDNKKYPVNYRCVNDCKGWTPLMIASAEGHISVVEFLLKKGADPNLQNQTGRTALHFAVRYDFYEIVELLLKNNANPNIKDFTKDNEKSVNSPMGDCLTQKKDTKILRLLVNNGGNVNYSYWDFTPLLVAAKFNDLELVKSLLVKGANPHHKKMNLYADQVSTNQEIKNLIFLTRVKFPMNFYEGKDSNRFINLERYFLEAVKK